MAELIINFFAYPAITSTHYYNDNIFTTVLQS